MDPTKRELRELKREIKRRGNKHRRQMLKQGLRQNPEEAHLTQASFGRHESARLNGIDRHPPRLPDSAEADDHGPAAPIGRPVEDGAQGV